MPVKNEGSPPIENMPRVLAQLNRANEQFWCGGGRQHVSEEFARGVGAAIAAVMRDGGVTGDSSMVGQRGLKAMNEQHRQHYSNAERARATDAPMPKGMPSPAAINQLNRAMWRSRGGSESDLRGLLPRQ
jgi:hypothetical protein